MKKLISPKQGSDNFSMKDVESWDGEWRRMFQEPCKLEWKYL